MIGSFSRSSFAIGSAAIVIAALLEIAPPEVRDPLAGWGAVFACIGLALRRYASREKAGVAPPVLPAAAALGLGVLAALLFARGWLAAGAPGFAHDWKWPLTHVQLMSWPSELRSLWLPWAEGAPAVQELAGYPIAIFAWLLGWVVSSSAIVLDVLLIATAAIGGLGAARLFAHAGLSRGWQAVAALAYPLLPQVYVRLSSGHLNWLLGFFLFPLILWFALCGAPRRGGPLGILWGLASAQVQFLLLVPIAIAATGRRALTRGVAIAATIAACAQAPMLASVATAHPSTAYASAHATLAWQGAQSSPVVLALAGVADPSQYFAAALPHAPALLAPLLLCALVGMWASGAEWRGLGIVTLVAGLWSAGLRGPFAPAMSRIYQSFLPSAAFREFSHAEILVSATLLVFAALGVHRLLKDRAVIGVAVLIAVLAPAVAPAAAGAAADIDPAVVLPPHFEAIVERVAELPGSGQVLSLPEVQPLSWMTTRGGADGLAFPFRNHPPFVDYQPTTTIVFALEKLSRGDPSACGLLGNLGVQSVVVRQDVHSLVGWSGTTSPSDAMLRRAGLAPLTTQPMASAYVVPCYRGEVTWATASVLRGQLPDIAALVAHGPTDEISLPPAPPTGTMSAPPPAPDYASVDPSAGWVSTDDDLDIVPSFTSAWSSVVFTRSKRASFDAPFGLAAEPSSRFRWKTRDEVRSMMARGAVGIWATARLTTAGGNHESDKQLAELPGATPANRSHELGASALGYFGPAPPIGSLVVLHQQSFGAWHASLGGHELRAYPADGVGVGWIVDGPQALTIRYAGPPIWLLWMLVIAAYAAGVTIAVVPFSKREGSLGA